MALYYSSFRSGTLQKDKGTSSDWVVFGLDGCTDTELEYLFSSMNADFTSGGRSCHVLEFFRIEVAHLSVSLILGCGEHGGE